MNQDLYGYPVEILAFDKGHAEGDPVAMLTVRHRPDLP
jgi:hypothetical protein